jgi:hypothetical protein
MRMQEGYKNRTILGKEYELHMDKEKRKINGSFYTPDYIIDYIIDNTIKDIDVVKEPFVKILDPSCGIGYFLIKVHDILMNMFTNNINSIREKYEEDEYIVKVKHKYIVLNGREYWRKENLHYHILNNCIYGADMDVEAAELTKKNLLSKGKTIFECNANVICCDSLIKWEEDYSIKDIQKINSNKFLCKYRDLEGCNKEKLLDSEELKSLSTVCNFWNNKYDYIIGNPPWVSLSMKQGKGTNSILKSYYMMKYNGNLYLPNLYEYFIKRSFELLKDGGIIGFIIPDRFAKNLQYKSLRKEILNKYNILNLVFEIKFPNINTDTMIFIVENNYRENNKIQIGIDNIRYYFINQQNYIQNSNYEFTYEEDNKYKTVKEKVERESKFLGDISLTFTGFIGDSKKITKTKVSNSQVEILKGENINRFIVLNNYYYEFIPENIKGGTKNIDKLTYKPKILIRKTGNKLIASLEDKGYIIEQSLYGVIKLDEKYSYKYILGIINSKFIEWYYVNFLVTNLYSTPQIKKYSLDKIPIKYCCKKKQKHIEKLVDTIIKENKITNLQNLKQKSKCLKIKNNILHEAKQELENEIFKLYNIDNLEREMILKSLDKISL